MNPFISLCMIVKNEEQVLGRCLDSVRHFIDEIIVVDTGSTDGTVEIAKRYTDKLYTFEWINDFSAARNEALKHATGKWILVMDADEYFEKAEIQKLVKQLEAIEPDPGIIYNLSIISFLGTKNNLTTNETSVGRVFGNRLGIRYTRPIHEQPVSQRGLQMKSAQLPVRLNHSGYAEETIRQKNKHQRNLDIFKQLEAEKGLSAYDHMQLANQYAMMNNHEQALSHLDIAIKYPKELGAAYKQVLFTKIQILINQGRLAKAFKFFEEYLTAYAVHPDMMTVKGIILMNIGLTEQAKVLFHRAVDEAERLAALQQPIAIVSPDMAMRLPLYQLAYLYEKEQDDRQAIYYYTKIIAGNPKDVDAISKLMRLLSLHDRPEAIVQFLDKLLPAVQLTQILLAKVSIALGQTELAATYIDKQGSFDLLKCHEQLRYCLLTNRNRQFQETWLAADADARRSSQVLVPVIVGALTWNRPDWLHQLQPEDEAGKAFLMWAVQWLNGQEDGPPNRDLTFSLLRFLYETKQDELFGRIIEASADAEIINRMANYFYEQRHMEQAIQYYEFLEGQGCLNAESYANMAAHYRRSHNTALAQQCLSQAIELAPNRVTYIVQYLLICSDTNDIAAAKSRLYSIDEDYASLTIF